MSAIPVQPVPEQGQIALLRQGRYIIMDVRASSLSSGQQSAQHLVSATSVEDDALGQEIQVIWDTEGRSPQAG